MNIDELGYYLYMQSEDQKEKEKEELTEEEKVNLEINPFNVSEQTTTGR